MGNMPYSASEYRCRIQSLCPLVSEHVDHLHLERDGICLDCGASLIHGIHPASTVSEAALFRNETGPEVIKKFMLNSVEQILNAHKYKNTKNLA